MGKKLTSRMINDAAFERRGYQPQATTPLPAQPKPPKGDTAVQAPKQSTTKN